MRIVLEKILVPQRGRVKLRCGVEERVVDFKEVVSSFGCLIKHSQNVTVGVGD